ncbi:hypothetical protein [Boudabousia marimammalium]|uniref:Pilus assembly protein TadE n=1 Tax=Boudabousia marimammalium TaxID=156892 RepID=A0A1Q5PM57_9ACTO|nr:hypothetical protein [Boudabousia marimammalium]OKL48092.1 hypothetical protein BM477_06435 [Boudabousia marimammalium]
MAESEEGEALIEFIIMTAVMIVPLIFLVSALASVQAAAYASQETAVSAAIMAGQGGDADQIAAGAHLVAQDFRTEVAQLEISCGACEIGDVVTVKATVTPVFPLVPAIGNLRSTITVPVSSVSRSIITVKAPQ